VVQERAGKQNDNLGGIAELLLQKSSRQNFMKNRTEAVGGITANVLLAY
jgi:hypothetical protein